MKCPICSNTTGIDIDMHSDGYADTLFECANCEALWMVSFDEIIMLHKKAA